MPRKAEVSAAIVDADLRVHLQHGVVFLVVFARSSPLLPRVTIRIVGFMADAIWKGERGFQEDCADLAQPSLRSRPKTLGTSAGNQSKRLQDTSAIVELASN